MNDPMQTLPPIIYLSDDREIKRLLVEHGHATDVEVDPNITEPIRADAVYKNEHYYVFVRRHLNYPNPADNGYVALLIHDSTPKEEAAELLSSITQFGATGLV